MNGYIFRTLTAGDTAIGRRCPLCGASIAEGDEVDTVDSTNLHRICVEAFHTRAEFYERQSSDLQVITNPSLRDELVDFLRWLSQYEEEFEAHAEYGALGWPKPTTIDELNDLEQQFEKWHTANSLLSDGVTSLIM